VFLTFVVVIGTLLLHGLTLPWFIRVLDVPRVDTARDALEAAAAQTRATEAAAQRLDELLAEERPGVVIHEHTPKILRAWNERRSQAAWEELGRSDDELGESPATTFRRLRLAMLAAERESFIAQRDEGAIDDEVLRALLHGLDLEEAALNRDRE
jgi:CPA1 family monovalent cation:H+ antiporter